MKASKLFIATFLFTSLSVQANDIGKPVIQFDKQLCKVLEKAVVDQYNEENTTYDPDKGIDLILAEVDKHRIDVELEAEMALNNSSVKDKIKAMVKKYKLPINLQRAHAKTVFEVQNKEFLKEVFELFKIDDSNSHMSTYVNPMDFIELSDGILKISVGTHKKDEDFLSGIKGSHDEKVIEGNLVGGNLVISFDKSGEAQVNYEITKFVPDYYKYHVNEVEDGEVVQHIKRLFNGRIFITRQDIERLRSRQKMDSRTYAAILVRLLPQECLEMNHRHLAGTGRLIKELESRNRGESGSISKLGSTVKTFEKAIQAGNNSKASN